MYLNIFFQIRKSHFVSDYWHLFLISVDLLHSHGKYKSYPPSSLYLFLSIGIVASVPRIPFFLTFGHLPLLESLFVALSNYQCYNSSHNV